MTDLETIKRAKLYMEKLANGIDPITDKEAPEDDIINNVRLSRCFFYVSGLLQRMIDTENDRREKGETGERVPFCLSPERRKMFVPEERPISLTRVTQRINRLVDLKTMQELKVLQVAEFLLQTGLLEIQKSPGGSRHKRPTDLGRQIGIITELHFGDNGEHNVVVYTPEAQRFIVDNLDAILAIKPDEKLANKGKPWKQEDDERLQAKFRSGMDVKTLAKEFKRTQGAIQSRIEKLGLI